MVERTPNPAYEAEEGKKTYSYYDKKLDCDFCGQEIKGVRVIKSRGPELRPVAVFCSYRCSLDWAGKNG